jgi:glycosyltransferase involved in cell wall biosynthesis
VHGSLPAGEESMADLARREGARTEFLSSLGQSPRPHRDASALARIAAISRRFRPHVVHTHMAKAGFVGRLGALAAVRPRPVIVHTYHGHVLEGYFGAIGSRVYRTLETRLARRSDRLVGVSQATVDDLVRLGVAPRDRFRVIPLGLDLAPFQDLDHEEGRRLRRELGFDDEDVVLTYLGRVVPIKRLDVLLRAVATAGDSAPLRLLVVGDGTERPRLEALSRDLRIADRVRFLGYRRDLAAIAAAADIGVLSSANEGTPVSLIEAAAAGVPAVASGVGGVPEVVTPDTGIVFPAGDPDAMAAALVRLATDRELRARLGANARKRALERYSAARLVADVDALYRELMDRRDGVRE